MLHGTLTVADDEVWARVKWQSTNNFVPDTDFFHDEYGDIWTDGSLDIRVQFKKQIGSVYFEIDPQISIQKGVGVELERSFNLPAEYQSGSDSFRQFDLSRSLANETDTRAIARIDQARVKYQAANWSLSAGREALTWGGGFVFHPLDLFNPFTPTAVDREFKPGSDLVLYQQLLRSGGDLQGLFIQRRDPFDQYDAVHTLAVKYHGFWDQLAYELLVGEHYGEQVIGLALSLPMGGALLHTDVSQLCVESECYFAGIVNLSYTISVMDAPVYMFGEYFHNQEGVTDVALAPTAQRLQQRIARGEIHTQMRDYVGLGLNFPWHPLWTQSFVFMANINEFSPLFQAFASFDPSDALLIQAGMVIPLGEDDSEFGTQSLIGSDRTQGGGRSLFVSLAWYF